MLCALLEFSFLTILTILSSIIDTFDFLTTVLYIYIYPTLGKALSFRKPEHRWTKKSLNRLALF